MLKELVLDTKIYALKAGSTCWFCSLSADFCFRSKDHPPPDTYFPSAFNPVGKESGIRLFPSSAQCSSSCKTHRFSGCILGSTVPDQTRVKGAGTAPFVLALEKRGTVRDFDTSTGTSTMLVEKGYGMPYMPLLWTSFGMRVEN